MTEVIPQVGGVSADPTVKAVLNWFKTQIGKADQVVEEWHNESGSFYRKYASGFIEQGGYVSGYIATSGEAFQVTLPKEFSDANYTALSTSAGDGPTRIAKRYTTHFFLNTYERATGSATWFACGY